MTQSPLTVSVIISNYNYGHLIERCVNSVLDQTKKAHQIIIVDDGSTDNSREILKDFKSIATVIAQENGGQAAAISRGVEEATGDIICLLDSDDLFAPQKIETLQKLYGKHEDAQWIFHTLAIRDGEGKPLEKAPEKIKKPKLINERNNMKAGDLDYRAPATSGLTFRREFIMPLFPLPHAKSIYISDHYIKFWAIAKAVGLHVYEPLGVQIIHGNNLYTGTKAEAARARIFINTAFHLRKAYPRVTDFCNSIVSEGMRCAYKAGIEDEMQPLFKSYCQTASTLDSLSIQAKLTAKRLLKR